MRRCPAVQENRLALLDQITAYPADRSLGFDVVDEPGHDISLRRRPSTERSAMGPLHQPLPFQDSKIFSQRGLADFRSEEHTSELQSPDHLVCRLLLEKKKARPVYYRCDDVHTATDLGQH